MLNLGGYYGHNETYFECDQVAEPLMGKLVADNCRNSLLIGRARLAVVVQQVRLTVRDQAPVLHCSGYKVRDGDHVLLGQRVWHVEVVLKVPQHLGPDALRVGDLQLQFNLAILFLI